jgi:hypothetical protein
MKPLFSKTTVAVEIVWRNPSPVRHLQRWQALRREVDRVLYVVQEFVCDGNRSRWDTSGSLEVIRGGSRQGQAA